MLLLCCQVFSNSDLCVHAGVCAWVCVWLCLCASRTITRLTGLTWRQEEQLDRWCDQFSAESQPWIGNREKGTEWGFRVERSVWQSEKHSDKDTRKEWTPAWPLELQTSRLWLTDRLWAEDGDAVTAPHQANWLVETGSVFLTPRGLIGKHTAIPLSEPRSGLLQRGIRDGV